MNQLHFKINRHYFYTHINLDLKRLDSWITIIDKVGIHVDHFTVVTNFKYRMSYKNKINHYINDEKIHWAYHLFHLYNEPTIQMYRLIPEKIRKRQDFHKLYRRGFNKGELIKEAIYINPREFNDLDELMAISKKYLKPRHEWV